MKTSDLYYLLGNLWLMTMYVMLYVTDNYVGAGCAFILSIVHYIFSILYMNTEHKISRYNTEIKYLEGKANRLKVRSHILYQDRVIKILEKVLNEKNKKLKKKK